MMLAAVSIDWAAVGAIGVLLLTVLGALIRLVRVATRIESSVKDHTAQIRQNSRHLDSLMASQWQTITRVATAEDFLHSELGYRPPVLLPRTDRPDPDGAA